MTLRDREGNNIPTLVGWDLYSTNAHKAVGEKVTFSYSIGIKLCIFRRGARGGILWSNRILSMHTMMPTL